MPNIIGVDLGVRAAHISTSSHCFSIGLKPNKGSRAEELQLIFDGVFQRFGKEDFYAFVEEPVVAGVRNLRTTIRIAQVSGAVLSAVNGELVPVGTWKKEIVGKGNASKEEVADWFNEQEIYEKPVTSQDHIDATCIRLYGESQSV